MNYRTHVQNQDQPWKVSSSSIVVFCVLWPNQELVTASMTLGKYNLCRDLNAVVLKNIIKQVTQHEMLA